MAKEVLTKIYAKSPDPDLEAIARKQEYGQAQLARLAHVNSLRSDINAKLATDLTPGTPLLDTGRFYMLKKSGTKITYTDGVFDGWLFIAREFVDLNLGAPVVTAMGTITHTGTNDLRIWKLSGTVSCLNDSTGTTTLYVTTMGPGAQLDDAAAAPALSPVLDVCRIELPEGGTAETHDIGVRASATAASASNQGWFDTEVEFLLPEGIIPTNS